MLVHICKVACMDVRYSIPDMDVHIDIYIFPILFERLARNTNARQFVRSVDTVSNAYAMYTIAL